MEHCWNDADRRKSVPLLRCPTQIPYGLTLDRPRAFIVLGRIRMLKPFHGRDCNYLINFVPYTNINVTYGAPRTQKRSYPG
jgi:hypothetical protein